MLHSGYLKVEAQRSCRHDMSSFRHCDVIVLKSQAVSRVRKYCTESFRVLSNFVVLDWAACMASLGPLNLQAEGWTFLPAQRERVQSRED